MRPPEKEFITVRLYINESDKRPLHLSTACSFLNSILQ